MSTSTRLFETGAFELRNLRKEHAEVRRRCSGSEKPKHWAAPIDQSRVLPFFFNLRAPSVSGFLHVPASPSGDVLILTHGAAENCQSTLLVALATTSCESGLTVLRCDLPFRQSHPHGPPPFRSADRDQQGLRHAVWAMKRTSGRVFLGGHSYGGHQATMLAVAEPGLVDGLLLLSYPLHLLHPSKKSEQSRTAHLPNLRTPALFVRGSRDSMAATEEMQDAVKLIPSQTELVTVHGAGHELVSARTGSDVTTTIAEAFWKFVAL